MVAVDVTVVHGQFHGADYSERLKSNKYEDISKQAGVRVVLFAITADGQGGPAARSMCEELAARVKAGQGGAMTRQAAWRTVLGRVALSFANAVARVIQQFTRKVDNERYGYLRQPKPITARRAPGRRTASSAKIAAP